MYVITFLVWVPTYFSFSGSFPRIKYERPLFFTDNWHTGTDCKIFHWIKIIWKIWFSWWWLKAQLAFLNVSLLVEFSLSFKIKIYIHILCPMQQSIYICYNVHGRWYKGYRWGTLWRNDLPQKPLLLNQIGYYKHPVGCPKKLTRPSNCRRPISMIEKLNFGKGASKKVKKN